MSYYSQDSTEVTLPWLVFTDQSNKTSQKALCVNSPTETTCSNVSSSGSDRFTPPEAYDKTKDTLQRMDEKLRSNLVITEVGPPTRELSYLEKIDHWFYQNAKHKTKQKMAKQRKEAIRAAELQAEKSNGDDNKRDQP